MISRRVLLSFSILGAVAAVTGTTTFAVLTSSTENQANRFTVGTVHLTDNDSGASLINLTSANPSDSDTGCIEISYDGSLPGEIRIYGSSSGTLAPYLNLSVTRGTDSTHAFDDCNNFDANDTNYIGSGPGVVYSGTLAGFPADWGSGIADAPGADEDWTAGEVHSFKFVISLDSNTAGQNKSATASFVWEARNQ